MNTQRWVTLMAAAGFSLAAGSVSVYGASAKENWAQHCVKCHGEDAKGNTRSGRKLKVKDLTSAKMQSRLAQDHDRMLEAIAEGSVDNDGNERMPAFRDKLTAQERAELLDYVRALVAGG